VAPGAALTVIGELAVPEWLIVTPSL
jgi:hypothetical protein